MNTLFAGCRWMKLVLPMGLLMTAHHARADSIDVTAKINAGTICTANIGDAKLSYGDIKLSELDRDKPTALPAKPLTLQVACAPFASKFFFRIIDRNGAYVPENLGPAAGVPDEDFIVGMGLGMIGNDTPIGELFLKSTAVLADTQTQIILHSNGGGGNPISADWVKRRSDFFWGSESGVRRYAVADPASETITAAKDFTIRMEAIPVIRPAAIDGLVADAPLDGRFTIEITQL